MNDPIQYTKHPDEKFEYGIIWSGLEDGEVIVSSTWTFTPVSITKLSSNHTDNVTWFWVESGKPGRTYTFTNRIVTNQGRHYVQQIAITV